MVYNESKGDVYIVYRRSTKEQWTLRNKYSHLDAKLVLACVDKFRQSSRELNAKVKFKIGRGKNFYAKIT